MHKVEYVHNIFCIYIYIYMRAHTHTCAGGCRGMRTYARARERDYGVFESSVSPALPNHTPRTPPPDT